MSNELASLIKDAANWSGIPRQPGVLQLERYMMRGSVIDPDDLTVIRYWINHGERLEGEPVSVDRDRPRTDEVYFDRRPRVPAP